MLTHFTEESTELKTICGIKLLKYKTDSKGIETTTHIIDTTCRRCLRALRVKFENEISVSNRHLREVYMQEAEVMAWSD